MAYILSIAAGFDVGTSYTQPVVMLLTVAVPQETIKAASSRPLQLVSYRASAGCCCSLSQPNQLVWTEIGSTPGRADTRCS